MWEESWARPTIQWLLTPTLITGGLLALARFFDPPTRWARRLKSDISILGGLPDGSEKQAWQVSIDRQAMRLREYRRAFVGWKLVGKWAAVVFVVSAVLSLVLWPPLNKPGQPAEFGPADWAFLVPGLYISALYIGSVSTGRDMWGHDPREILLRRRLKQYKRRYRKLRFIEKARAKRAETDSSINPRGSRLGFRTQVDEFGPWMRSSNLRGYVSSGGWIGSDIKARWLDDLRREGTPLPEWPDPVTRRAPEPQPEPALHPRCWRKWLRFLHRRSG